MMVIRPDQFGGMQAAAEQKVFGSICRYLREHYAELFDDMDDESLLDFVTRAAQRARAYRLESAAAIAWFVVTLRRVSPRFDEEPAIRACLLDPETRDTPKIRKLLASLNDAVWERAHYR